MTDYAKLEIELRKIAGGDATWDAIAGGDLLACKVADALAQAVRERDEWKAGYERMSEEFARVCWERDELAASAERAAELARQHGDDLIKAEAELASVREVTDEMAAVCFRTMFCPGSHAIAVPEGDASMPAPAILELTKRGIKAALKTKEPT